MIVLRYVDDNDRKTVRQWPPYPPDFADLDYALRVGGWLDAYREKPDTVCFAVEVDGDLIGFTILSRTGDGEAEFRIALHPERTGGGLGGRISELTLEKGFGELGYDRIHLIVRKANPRAASVYRRIGFTETGSCVKTIDGKLVELLIMEKFRPGAGKDEEEVI
jgi:diamine N-acetyltransferase